MAWQKAESFVGRDILDSSLGPDKKAEPIAPVKLAVFDFELEDLSGGAEIIPESDEDREELRLATETARRLIAESGRYSLVDVSNAADVKTHNLRKCDGCDAAIALKLGADQSLVGAVNHISRMEYGVTFRLRDARTGKLLFGRADRPAHGRQPLVEPRSGVAHQKPVARETSAAISARASRL